MKAFNSKSIKIYFLYPTLGKYHEEALFFGRSGFRLQMDSGFTRLYDKEDRGDWLSLSILGFGIGFYWNFTEDTW